MHLWPITEFLIKAITHKREISKPQRESYSKRFKSFYKINNYGVIPVVHRKIVTPINPWLF